jgi:trimeric autotransporter adhesin
MRTITKGVKFVGNSAAIHGGAIYIDSYAKNLFFTGLTFSRNTALKSGGAVYISESNAKLYFYSSLFEHNRALQSGGAVAISMMNTPLLFKSCIFRGNEAEVAGAVNVDVANGNGLLKAVTDNTITFANSLLAGNTATLDGGALLCSEYNALKIFDTQFEGNIAGRDGGAIAMSSKRVSNALLVGNTFTQNHARNSGGGLFSLTLALL